MVEKIKELLVGGLDIERINRETAALFYDWIEIKNRQENKWKERLGAYDTMTAFCHIDQDKQDFDEQEALLGLDEDIEYLLQTMFDQVEDDVKHQLLKGKNMTEDELEEQNLEAFQQFDALRASLTEALMGESPASLYGRGKEQIDHYREEQGLLMDESEILDYYESSFSKDRLWELLALKIYQTIHYNRHYIMEDVPDDEEEEPKLLEEDEQDIDGVLMPGKDMAPEDFTIVYELMREYTGRRVLSSENEWSEAAYWPVYAEEFIELFSMYMVDHLEKVLKHFAEEETVAYATFAKANHLKKEQWTEPEAILKSCDRVSYYLSDKQESLWNLFCEETLAPLYDMGKKMEKA